MESQACWFEDFGSGIVVKGNATVTIDPLFAATVDSSQYHIFLTPHGDSKGLYVSAVDAASFTVREQQGGVNTVAFSYRVVARRTDVAAPRLAVVTLPSLPTARTEPSPAAQPELKPPAMQILPIVPATAAARPHDQGAGTPPGVATPLAPPVSPMVPTPPEPPVPQA
jgi:hypothetical protein